MNVSFLAQLVERVTSSNDEVSRSSRLEGISFSSNSFSKWKLRVPEGENKEDLLVESSIEVARGTEYMPSRVIPLRVTPTRLRPHSNFDLILYRKPS